MRLMSRCLMMAFEKWQNAAEVTRTQIYIAKAMGHLMQNTNGRRVYGGPHTWRIGCNGA